MEIRKNKIQCPSCKAKGIRCFTPQYVIDLTKDHKKRLATALKEKLCVGNFNDLDGNKVDCEFSLKKQSYKKRRCEICEIIDNTLYNLNSVKLPEKAKGE